ncbi:MAG TPA: FHA domain-containing protein [Steroidobacteraceae bacterium]|nr:FHA domain-containing protein [Steroidobacteraceae bacterium]
MRAVIRFLSRGHAGAVEQRDRVFEGDAITIGRATDQVLHLKDRRVGLQHARILRSGDRILISVSAVSGVLVNGVVRRDAEIHPGDVVQVGSNILKFVAPPAGFDLAIAFELDAAARAAEAVRERPQLDIANTRLNRRIASWVLFIAIAALGLLVPLLTVRSPDARQTLAATLLPSDQAWSSGPLHSAHQNLASRCETCHEQPFVRVRSSACLECHGTSVHRHVGVAANVEQLDSTRCARCHAEHNEPATLVRPDAGLCVDCHGRLERVVEEPGAATRVTDFAREHPEFRVSLLTPRSADGASNEWALQRETLGVTGFREQSRLEFPHDTHLDPKGIKAPDGTVVMKCADCHVPEAGGKRMQPVRMEEHCQSCHRLDFEPADPARQVPHGTVTRVVQTLNEYYSARYLEGYPDPLAVARPDRRVGRPGVQLSPAERARLLAAASDKAWRVARDLIERRTCQDCHVVEVAPHPDPLPKGARGTDGDALLPLPLAGEGAGEGMPWRVLPVLLTTEWMPKAHFDHARHATTLSDCDSCHAARESHDAADVLMPRIAACRECHGGTGDTRTAENRVASTCMLCHSFHVETNPLWDSIREHPSGFARISQER